jgi:hypothetical protein
MQASQPASQPSCTAVPKKNSTNYSRFTISAVSLFLHCKGAENTKLLDNMLG